VGTNPTGVWV